MASIAREVIMNLLTGGLASQVPDMSFSTVSATDWNSKHPGAKVTSTQYVDPNTGENITDKVLSGGVPLYQKPSLTTRAFNPYLANEINQANMQFEGAPTIAQQREATQRGIIGQQVGTLPSDNQPFGNNQQANITAAEYAGLSPNALLSGQRSTALMNQGLPATEAQAASQEAQKQARYTGAFNTFGGPESTAATDVTGSQLQGGRNVYGLQYLPTEAETYGIGQGNQLTQQQQLQAKLPYTGQAELNQAMLQSKLARQALQLSPYTEQQMSGEAMKGALAATHMAPTEPFDVQINPETGGYHLGRSPIGLPSFYQNMMALQGGMPNADMFGGTTQVQDPSTGKVYNVKTPPKDTNILTGQSQDLGTQTPQQAQQNQARKVQQQQGVRQPITQPMSLGQEIGQGLYDTYVPHGPVWGPNAIKFYHWLQGY